MGAVSGEAPVSGTAWEFEDALAARGAAARRRGGTPDLLFYHKTALITAPLDNRANSEARLAQKEAVDALMARGFKDAEGRFYMAAYREFADTAEFEALLEENLRCLLARHLAPGGAPPRWTRPPWRGLEAFEYEHAPVFFGRARARAELRDLLEGQMGRGSAFMLVLGASGSGKSSLVRAVCCRTSCCRGWWGGWRCAVTRCCGPRTCPRIRSGPWRRPCSRSRPCRS